MLRYLASANHTPLGLSIRGGKNCEPPADERAFHRDFLSKAGLVPGF